eukprot:gene2460-2695_t
MDPTKKDLYKAKRSSGLDVTGDGRVAEMVTRLRSGGPLGWLLMTIQPPGTLTLHSSGTDITDMIANLSEDEIFYGAFRCAVQGQIKFLHFYFLGENVPALKKGKASLNKPAAFSVIDAHGEIAWVSGLSSLTAGSLMEEVGKIFRCPVDQIVWTFE